jgi:cytochrome c-type biogenesis protein CcmH
MTLYIYAKVPNAPGPPLAVSRVAAGSWPARFVLDDTQSMLPDRRLSDFPQVIIEARLSKSGQAIAAAGDLQGRSGTVDTRAARPVNLKIDQVIG